MKVFIISPPNTIVKRDKLLKRRFFAKRSFRTHLFPVEIITLAPVLTNEGHEVRVLDGLVEDRDLEDIINDIENFQPDFVLLTPFDRDRWGLEGAIAVANSIKKGKTVLLWSHLKELMVLIMKNNPKIGSGIYGDPD